MSETTATTTTTTAAKKPTKSNWKFAGYWNALIGGFVLLISGFLTFFTYLAPGLYFIGSASFFTLAYIPWLTGLIQMLLGFLVLFLIWEWLQDTLKTGTLIKDSMWLGIILILVGLITGGLGGVLVLVGGIYYLLSIKK
ncbi:MAG: hypothetical protein HeimAB125_06490 [Candidatus Heimdallarchaeota archaeon AB_125]|nr:MAG: hypothetical protein HeimAB125_06490 [Candidatus Heimdallarchaeota archaeon AB_125]